MWPAKLLAVFSSLFAFFSFFFFFLLIEKLQNIVQNQMSKPENFSVEWSCFSKDNEVISELLKEIKGKTDNSITAICILLLNMIPFLLFEICPFPLCWSHRIAKQTLVEFGSRSGCHFSWDTTTLFCLRDICYPNIWEDTKRKIVREKMVLIVKAH